MSIEKGISEMIYKLGDRVVIETKNEKLSSKAIIQPLMYKNKMYLGGDVLPSGYYDSGHYLMIAPPVFESEFFDDVFITDGEIKYLIKRCENVRCRDKTLYIWAVLVRCYDRIEEDEDADK